MRVLFLLLVAMTSAEAEDRTFTLPVQHPVFSMAFPDLWMEKGTDNSDPDTKDEDAFLEMASPDDAVEFDVWILQKSDDPARVNTRADIDKYLASWLTDIHLQRNSAGDFTVGTLRFTSSIGSGRDKNGEPQEIELDFCRLDARDEVALCYCGDRGARKKYQPELASIFHSARSLANSP